MENAIARHTTHQNLIEEILDELLLQWPGSEQPMKIGSEEFSDEVDIFERRNKNIAQADDLSLGVRTDDRHALGRCLSHFHVVGASAASALCMCAWRGREC